MLNLNTNDLGLAIDKFDHRTIQPELRPLRDRDVALV